MSLARPVRRFIGVYDADGSLRGELSYWVGARLGRTHCALCDITHSLVRERADWKECRASLPVPFELYHRDDQPLEVRAAADREPPYVLADAGDELVVVLDRAALDACRGDLEQFRSALEGGLDRTGLVWSDGAG
jgi:hypothetical protein